MPSKTVYRILAFDPSANEMGFVVIEFDITTGISLVIHTEVIEGPRLIKTLPLMRKHFTKQFCTMSAINTYSIDLFEKWSPDFVVSESAFAGRFIAALISLILVIHSIQRACCTYFGKDIHLVSPTETKSTIAKKHHASKDEIRAAVLQRTDIQFSPDILLPDGLSEHEFDAIGHGVTFCLKYLSGILNGQKK